jgi:hypothetical protein
MKQCVNRTMLVLMVTAILFSCKKDGNHKNYKASVKDKTWSGEITYTNKTTEYYSVHFNADNTLEWVQLSGDYTGHWSINDRELTLSFDANTVQIKANISDDDKLVNITDNTGAYEINSGHLIANPAMSLDNTLWKGSRANTPNGIIETYQIRFLPDNKIEIKVGNTIYSPYSYTRRAAGAAIRAAGGFFGVLLSASEIKGSDGNAAFPWQTVKQ